MGKYKTIMDIILKNRIEYIKKYDEEPKYVKIPRLLVNEIKEIMQEMVTFSVDFSEEPITVFGMLICDTLSIDKINEIEVF